MLFSPQNWANVITDNSPNGTSVDNETRHVNRTHFRTAVSDYWCYDLYNDATPDD
jgi:hypothetical protein